MAYTPEKLENKYKNKHRSGVGKWYKKMRNRKIRRTPFDMEPSMKFRGWVF